MMGLVERSIDMLISASSDPARLPICSSVLGGILLDRGETEAAALWYQRGLLEPSAGTDTRIELSRGLVLATMLAKS